ncbi:hypothetical protein [Nostoc sphaeroides]|uniref:Uncharacterized protein n=1 Tax=Nostoc sphaeroides CCNUC1 TaxID=2653204 RepID=A0A5P8WHD5_9NOSO|nr:hypothetical protein [Nostoc sphaeroides]QFS51576.1 hypothetical protein GXM_09070 [Nostoc sphaeroides CCNUC1]
MTAVPSHGAALYSDRTPTPNFSSKNFLGEAIALWLTDALAIRSNY